MRCQQVRRAWLEPELSAKARRHMQACPACQREWELNRRLNEAFSGWEVERPLPAEWDRRLQQRIATARTGWRGWLESWRWRPHPQPLRLAAGALLLLLVAGAGLYVRPRWFSPRAVKPASTGIVRDLQALNQNQEILQCPLFAGHGAGDLANGAENMN